MTLPDYLRTASGDVYRITPTPIGEWDIDSTLPDPWTNATHAIPTESKLTFRTVKDENGKTWYLTAETEAKGATFEDDEGTLVLNDVAPTALAAGVWYDHIYNEQTVQEGTTIDYLALQDSDAKTWYLYPSPDGETIITDVEPS